MSGNQPDLDVLHGLETLFETESDPHMSSLRKEDPIHQLRFDHPHPYRSTPWPCDVR
jgi:hypothetical protein